MTTANLPTYSTISLYETQRLAKVKASGCAVLTYQVLCGYSRVGKFFAFPSHETISKALGMAYSLRAIRQAILFLEKHKIIKRKNSGTTRRTKTIHLITRKARHLAEKLFEAKAEKGQEFESPRVGDSQHGNKSRTGYYSNPNPSRNKSATMQTAPPPNQYNKRQDQINQRTGTNQPQKRTNKRTRFYKEKNNVPEWRVRGNFGAFERSQPTERTEAEIWYEEAGAHLLRPDLWEPPAKPNNPHQVWEAVKAKAARSIMKPNYPALKALLF